MATEHHLVTADELWRLVGDDARHELVQGELVSMTPSNSEHGSIAGAILAILGSYVRDKRLGKVLAADAGYLIQKNPDTVLVPDASFIRIERVPAEGMPRKFFPGAPDLAVEVVSPHDSSRDVRAKVEMYLAGGAQMVWVVDPIERKVEVSRAPDIKLTLTESDTLDGYDVIPGFRCQVQEIFE